MQQLSCYIYRYLVRSLSCSFLASALDGSDSRACKKKDPVTCHAHSDSVFPPISHKVKPVDAKCRGPALYAETEGIFSSWRESKCFPATPFVLMFPWLGTTERLSTKHSLEPVLRWGFTQIPPFWMTAFTPSAGKLRHTHIYTHTRLKFLVRAPVITKSSEPPLCLPAPSYSQTAYSCSPLSYTHCLFPLPVCKSFSPSF